MINGILQHKVALIVVIVIVLGGVWYMFTASAPAPTLTTSGADTTGDNDLVSTLLALRAITLDGSVLQNPEFVTLKDFSTAIVPEPVGRPDPFAPLPTSVSPSAATTKSAQIFKPAH